ncbi:MAG: serine hydrolase domain-containing protein [Pseudomonadota bacterium]
MRPAYSQFLTGLIAFCLLSLTANARDISTARPESVGMSSKRLERINEVMDRHIEAGDIQGAVTIVARRGKIVHYEAHGLMDVATKTPMSKDALFIMWSSTKPVLGVAAMMMIEEGKFRPSDPVSMYIPEFKDMQVAVLAEPADENISPRRVDPRGDIPAHRLVPAEREITIHHLLTHTSGLLSGGLGSAIAPRLERDTLASFIPKLGDVPLDFQPGTRWSYSPATGLDVVARVIEIVSGLPFDEFVRTRILDPLGMIDTHYNLPPEKASRRVIPPGRNIERITQPTTYFPGSFGLTSTAMDYLRFEQMLLNGGTYNGNRLLSPRTVTMMGSNQVGDLFSGLRNEESGMGFGYTVSVVLDPIVADSRRSKGAFGWGGAWGTRSWTDPAEELTGVLMLQQSHPRTQYDFENAVRQAIIE